jgi:hypothetical protein
MLPLPESDATEPTTLAAWLELSLLAVEDSQVSFGAVAEELRDSNLLHVDEKSDDLHERQTAAEELATNVWSVLEERQRLLGPSSPFIIQRRVIRRRESRKRLEDVAAYVTMLLIEAAGKGWYPKIELKKSDEMRTDFEIVAAAALFGLGNTQVERLGVPYPGMAIKRFRRRVKALVAKFALAANEQELKRFTHPREKDRGLDLVVRIWNDDASGGMPYLLVQCATGIKWVHDKAAEPPMTAWKKFATWDGPALKSIAVPFTVSRPKGLGDAWLRTNNSLILDRLRLSRGNPDRYLDPKSRVKLTKWCNDQFARL